MDPDPAPVSAKDLLRWSESLAAIARTGLGFTESLYERERFEEVLKVAADIRVAAGHELESEVLVEEWLKQVGEGVAGWERWAPHAFRAIRGDHVDVLFDPPRKPMWRSEEDR